MKNKFFTDKFVLTPKFAGSWQHGGFTAKNKFFTGKFVLTPKFVGSWRNGD